MAEMLVLNRESWMHTLDQKQIDAYCERSATGWMTMYDTRMALTPTEITQILRPLSEAGRTKWLARQAEFEAMTQKDIDTELAYQRSKFTSKYNARQRKGDIVEIQEDGFWTVVGRGFDKVAFDLVVVPKLTVKEAKEKYQGSLEDENTLDAKGNITMVAKFKGNITTTPDVTGKQELTEADFETAVEVKTIG